MQKILVISLILVIATALAVPIFADDVINALNNATNSTDNSSLNESANNSSISNNSTLNNSINSTLTPEQLQTMTVTQNKLAALIATISGLKATYGNNTKSRWLLNALDQYEKQANKLNDEINAFIKDPSINSTEVMDGRINSFVKKEAALEHKVSIKQGLLLKMNDKTLKSKKSLEIKNNVKNENKNNGKNKNN